MASKSSALLLPKIAMIYVTIMLIKSLLSYKLVSIFNLTTMGGAITIPLWFIFSDIIAEVYGYRVAKTFIIWAFFCQLIFSIIGLIIIRLPSPGYWHEQHAFNLVIGSMLRITLSDLLAYVVAGFLNIYVLTKWKVILIGKYFVLRCLGSSLISELIYTIIAVFSIQIGKLNAQQMSSIIFISFLTKVICSIILPVFATFIVSYIRSKEKLEEFSHELNPFYAKQEKLN